MRLVSAGLALVLAACSVVDVPPTGTWVPVETIEGPLQAEIQQVSPARVPRLAPTGPLRIVSYNVETGVNVDGLTRALSEDPRLATAGLLLLQEMESHPGEGGSRASRLADALGLSYVYIPAREKGDGTHGLALMSPFPIENVEKMDLPHLDLPLAAAGMQRIAVSADVRVGALTVHVIDVHLDTQANVVDRILQLRPAVIDAPDDVLVAGDFNMNNYLWAGNVVPVLPVASVAGTDQAPIIDDYMAQLGFATPTADLGATERMYGIEERLDAIYTRGIELAVEPAVGIDRDVSVSDHWPLWIDLAP